MALKTLCWIPAPPSSIPHRIRGEGLCEHVMRRLFEADGGANTRRRRISVQTPYHIGYVQALTDIGMSGASELREAMSHHDAIMIWIED